VAPAPALRPVASDGDILPAYRDTPVGRLLRYHALGAPLPPSAGHAELLVAMCMDNRKELRVPNEFAYVLRSAGGNLRDREFDVSYAVAVGGVSAIALLAHTDCGMAGVTARRETFVAGLAERGGWTRADAERHFEECAVRYQIGDPVAFVVGEAARLRRRYPGLLVAPLLYRVEDDTLTQIVE
jgi:carbonic anhydrase